MGRDIVYLPGYYMNDTAQQCNYPFILDVFGKVHQLKPDTIHTHTLCLSRKYPISNRVINHSAKIIGGYIQASNDSLFRKAETFHIIARNTQGAPDTVKINPQNHPYRYWRYLAPNGSFCQIAELQFSTADTLPSPESQTYVESITIFCEGKGSLKCE